MDGETTKHIWDGANITLELDDDNTVTGKYLRGLNLIAVYSGNNNAKYYLYNAHGDVVQLTGITGLIIFFYDYDAFGNEQNPNPNDINPFRYCGEYFDSETGTYYLRARYYDPRIGRFTQEDTHWNPGNMIYGDSPVENNYYHDLLGLSIYVPNLSAILQSGNLYGYCMGNPVMFFDANGY